MSFFNKLVSFFHEKPNKSVKTQDAPAILNSSNRSHSSPNIHTYGSSLDAFPCSTFLKFVSNVNFSDDFVRVAVDEFTEEESKISTSITCRTIRIGSYKFDSKEKVRNDKAEMKIVFIFHLFHIADCRS